MFILFLLEHDYYIKSLEHCSEVFNTLDEAKMEAIGSRNSSEEEQYDMDESFLVYEIDGITLKQVYNSAESVRNKRYKDD